jgi:hypothetical protein
MVARTRSNPPPNPPPNPRNTSASAASAATWVPALVVLLLCILSCACEHHPNLDSNLNLNRSVYEWTNPQISTSTLDCALNSMPILYHHNTHASHRSILTFDYPGPSAIKFSDLRRLRTRYSRSLPTRTMPNTHTKYPVACMAISACPRIHASCDDLSDILIFTGFGRLDDHPLAAPFLRYRPFIHSTPTSSAVMTDMAIHLLGMFPPYL